MQRGNWQELPPPFVVSHADDKINFCVGDSKPATA